MVTETALCICVSVLVYGLVQIITKNDFFIENLKAVIRHGKTKSMPEGRGKN